MRVALTVATQMAERFARFREELARNARHALKAQVWHTLANLVLGNDGARTWKMIIRKVEYLAIG